jgi:hypothetical protein
MIINHGIYLDMMSHTYIPSTVLLAEEGGSRVQGQSGLYCKLEAGLGYIASPKIKQEH